MSYFEWHEEPGYWGDVARHFSPDTRLLDVGCGSAWLANHFPLYTGIDAAPEAVQSARERGLNVVEGDVSAALPFDDGAYDGVVLKDVLEHLRDAVAVVRDVQRVLAPGGLVFASSPDAQRWVWDDYTHVRPFTRKAYRLLFADNGFAVRRVAYESVMPGTSIVSRRTPANRRPAPLVLASWLPIVRRNVWLLAQRA